MDIITSTPKTNFIMYDSRISAIQKCGRYYEFQYGNSYHLESIKGKGNSQEIGSVIHKFMEVYYRNQSLGIGKSQAFGFGMSAAELYISGCVLCSNFEIQHQYDNALADEIVNHVCNEHCKLKPSCGHAPNEYPGLTNTPAESEGYITGWKFALQTCDEYHKHYASDFWVTLETEVTKGKILYEDDEIRILFKSKIDWVVDTNNGIFPCDHKTMKQNRDTSSMNNQFMSQCLIMGTRNVYINKIGLQKTLKPVDKFKRVAVSYSAARLMEWQSVILPYWCKTLKQYAEQEYFPPNFQSCENKFGKCSMYEICESDPDMRNEVLQMNFIKGREWENVSVDEE